MKTTTPEAHNATPGAAERIEAPPMTRDQALAAAREMWGPRGDTVKLGVSHFVGYQISKDRWNWIGHGHDWQSAIADANAQEPERKAKSAELKERLGRVVVRIDGDVITREWHGKTYTVTRVADGFEFAGVRHKSLTAIAKSITGAKAISGPRFFGVAEQKEIAR